MLVDSHCHLNMLNLAPFQGNMDILMEQAKKEGVQHILCVGVDLINASTVIDIATRYSDVSASVGLHPSEKINREPTVDEIVEWAMHPKVVAIGETGLDYYYNREPLDDMRERFRRHIRAARDIKKPLIIHSRNAREDTIRIMKEENAKEVGGVMHCFTENLEMAEQAMELSFYISFSGIVTFKNAKDLSEVAKRIPLEKMLIETDAPYLTPEPFRGKPNLPQYVRYVAERIAELKNTNFDSVAEQTTKNYFRLFMTAR